MWLARRRAERPFPRAPSRASRSAAQGAQVHADRWRRYQQRRSPRWGHATDGCYCVPQISQPSVAHMEGGSVAADSVEREILIEASPEVVWGVITEPEQ